MTKKIDVAIVGVTGVVGEMMLSILEERRFPVGKLYPLASARSAGKTVKFNGESVKIEELEGFDFNRVQIVLSSAGGAISAEFAPLAVKAGCLVIDNTSHFRYDKDVPLVIAEVNPHALAQYQQRNIIANPNCCTMQMLVALKPLHDAVGIKRINVATYQSVSGSGRKAIAELTEQTHKLLRGEPADPQVFPCQIAFNVLPQCDDFTDNGYTKEEMKIIWETRKILEDANIMVNPTAVRVPVFYGHAEAINIETRDKLTATQARQLLQKAPGVVVMDEHKAHGYPTPSTKAAGQDPVYVGRIREDISHPNALNLWVVADNIRKGAALNAVQIAEIMVEKYL